MPPGRLVVSFDEGDPGIGEIGGKALSLARMARAGIPVPPGFVLTVELFAPWLEHLRALPEWRAFAEARDDAALRTACDALKAIALGLELGPASRGALAEKLAVFPDDALFAVRSSSPEEDLEGSSFAGGYETVLGVRKDAILPAVRHAFASCLDVRVAVYKREHGFDPRSPRIAVVVQRQIASEVAGVAFSVDPISNDHDVAVLSSNWGLGETVVAGTATPDLFRIDRVTGRVLERTIGAKETSVWLGPDGGTVERPDPRHDVATLGDPQLAQIVSALGAIESLYGKPMDVEWAFAEGHLHLLQARPVTTHFSIPDALRTEPGARRRLYWDVTISVQGLLRPMSPLGTSVLRRLATAASRRVLGVDVTRTVEGTIPLAVAGRLLVNLSNALALAPVERIEGLLSAMDPFVARALRAGDPGAYRADAGPMRRLRLRAASRMLPLAPRLLSAILWPEAARDEVDRASVRFEADLAALAETDASLETFVARAISRAVDLLIENLLPRFLASKVAMSLVRRMFAGASADVQAAIASLDRSLPGNVTVEMGLALARIAARLPPDFPATLPPAWHEFLRRYGHRGPTELDVASPRYREKPDLLLAQVAELAAGGDAGSAEAVRAKSRSEREAATAFLDRAVPSPRRFRHLVRVIETLGGLRETPKFHLVQVFDEVRRRALARGERLAAEGRLDRPSDVFDLDLDDLSSDGVDLRARAAAHRAVHDRMARYPELPRLFDSRGRILRAPPRRAGPGELAGHPVSPGVARGPVVVLHSPDEKPLRPGDVLVARATDPGWTPLFVSAAAVVLEVGGLMQHGALVAREYGKPCVAGVEGATRLLSDGERVEVDGAAGIVRRVAS